MLLLLVVMVAASVARAESEEGWSHLDQATLLLSAPDTPGQQWRGVPYVSD